MSDRFIVEVAKRTVGIAVRDAGGFRFFAADPAFFALEGKLYADLRTLNAAAARHAAVPPPAPAERPAPRVAEEEPPGWFRWAVLFGIAGSSALGAALVGAAQ